ncbi:hypothetical protein [Streptomyces sp. ID05-04B]|nr:hypothetical protein [Streptomyces sp. ID05-04B]
MRVHGAVSCIHSTQLPRVVPDVQELKDEREQVPHDPLVLLRGQVI